MSDPGTSADDSGIDPLLGEQRMVADPRIAAGQAAVILGSPVAYVYRLIATGRLAAHGKKNSTRRVLLSEVTALRDRGEPIPLKEAVRILRATTDEVRQLMADGRLTSVPRARRPVYREEVEELARNRGLPIRRPASAGHLAPEGHVNTAQAEGILGLGVSRTRQLAATARIPAHRDANGNFYYSLNHLEMTRRAWQAAKDFDEPLPEHTPPATKTRTKGAAQTTRTNQRNHDRR